MTRWAEQQIWFSGCALESRGRLCQIWEGTHGERFLIGVGQVSSWMWLPSQGILQANSRLDLTPARELYWLLLQTLSLWSGQSRYIKGGRMARRELDDVEVVQVFDWRKAMSFAVVEMRSLCIDVQSSLPLLVATSPDGVAKSRASTLGF
jgi:hypothetical protein